MTWFEIISTLIAVFVVAATLYRIHFFIKAFKADHERRKKQATIEFVGNILREVRLKIDAKYKFKTLTEADILRIKSEPEEEAELRNTLGAIEHLMVGVHTGVYDKDILYRMSASYITNLFDRVKPYVDKAREDFTPAAYTEFEQIAREFQSRRRGEITVLHRGEIKHS
jgi:hypothetical protein